MSERVKICIYGPGAVGGFVGALLAKAGAEVSVVARGAALQAIRQNGLRLRRQDGEIAVSVSATDDPATLGPQDYVVLAVKAPALPAIVPKLAPLLGPETAVVTAMNGMLWWFFDGGGPRGSGPLRSVDPGGAIARALPRSRVIGCVVHSTSSQPEPGVIRHGVGDELIIGEATGGVSARVRNLGRWLDRGGFHSKLSADIQQDAWVKLWGNMNFNPISLLTGATADRIIDDPDVYALCISTMREFAAIGQAIGYSLPMTPEARIAMARKLGAFKTSMLQDVEAGRPVELDALLAAVHEIGARVGVPTPFIGAMLGLARLRAAQSGLYEPLAAMAGAAT